MNERQWLIDRLRSYPSTATYQVEEANIQERFLEFVETEPECFERSHHFGHVTGSACVVDVSFQKVLLVFHRKLNRWLQPGGHSDGNPNTEWVARREVEEETGLTQLEKWGDGIFDLDIHQIPSKGSEPGHLHFDVRFLFRSLSQELQGQESEVADLRWIPLGEIERFTQEESILRMIRKLDLIADIQRADGLHSSRE